MEHELFDNRFTGKQVAEAVIRLFDGDGTIYLTTGYLTWSGYLAIQNPLKEFLSRSTENRIYIVVAAAADQFSRLVANALWDLDADGQVHLLAFRDGFMHPKLYLRDGADPAFVMGSANLTWDGLGKNLEFAWYYRPGDQADQIFRSHLEWVRNLVERSDPVTARDLARGTRLRRTAKKWLSKGRLNLSTWLYDALAGQPR
jgi:hypothetical protein